MLLHVLFLQSILRILDSSFRNLAFSTASDRFLYEIISLSGIKNSSRWGRWSVNKQQPAPVASNNLMLPAANLAFP